MTGDGECPGCGALWDPGARSCFACGYRAPGPEAARKPARKAAPAPEPQETPDGSTAGPQLTLLSDVEPEHVTWLWDQYLPLRKLVVVDGDPGLGKSTLAVDLAARVSAGAPMPDGTPGRKGAVLVLSAEDGLADTIRPRLDAAGGDPARVIAMTGIAAVGEDGRPYTRPVTLPGDIPLIESVTAARGVLLVVVDVLMAYLSGTVDSYRDQDVRRALAPLAAMAERTGCCVLVLRHLSKNGGQRAVYRGGGSIGIIGAARAAFICGPDPGDDTGRRNVFASSKSNLARTPPSLAYTLEPGGGCACVAWHGESGLRASALLADPETADERAERDEAAEWLAAWLSGHGGEGKAGDIIRAAAKDGIVPRTLQRARRKAHVSTERVGYGRDGCWVWRLPAPAGDPIGDTKTPKTPGSEDQTSMASIDAYDGGGGDPAEPRSPAPVLCTVCRLPLWPALAEAGWTTHPDCEPDGTTQGGPA